MASAVHYIAIGRRRYQCHAISTQVFTTLPRASLGSLRLPIAYDDRIHIYASP